MTITKLDDLLWVGNKDDGKQDAHEYDVVINVAKDWQYIPKNTNYIHIGLVDGSHNELETIGMAIELLTEVQRIGKRTLIHCISGSSRSTTIAAAFLSRKRGTSLDEELAKIKSLRPYINPVPSFVALVQRYLDSKI